MHNVSVKMNDSEYNLLDGMAKANHKSKAEVMREALQVKRAFDERERRAIMEGLKSAKNEPLTSHADAIKEFAVFRENHKHIAR